MDVEGDSEFEEWTEGQRRRTLAAITHGGGARMNTEVDGETDDVIVDGDEPEESTFGPSQYTESDVVIKACGEKAKEKEGVQSQVATVNSSGDVEVINTYYYHYYYYYYLLLIITIIIKFRVLII